MKFATLKTVNNCRYSNRLNNKLQFQQSLDSERDKTAQALLRSKADMSTLKITSEQFDAAHPRVGSAAEYYLYGRNLIRLADEKPDWQQSLLGRIATRLISRGIFGALAFTWMGNYASRSLKNYDPACIQNWSEFGKALTNVKSTSMHFHQTDPNIMSAIAKTFDVVAGKPIQYIARSVAPEKLKDVWAKSSVTFRQRAMFHDPISKLHHSGEYVLRNYGRSLGHEVVGVTADFAAASAADATFRNIIQAIDPNTDKDREKNPNAEFDWYRKGKFSLSSFAADTGKRVWKIISFNQGEDWAVALPYVYFMKWHRNAINNISPGFKIASDNPQWNASSDKLRQSQGASNKPMLEHIGDFGKEGAWDLQARFSTYNVLTLMYRETYTKLGDTLSNFWQNGFHPSDIKIPSNPIVAAVESVGDVLRYGLKSFIKANIYMQPAVPFFWSFRVPQSKWRASPVVVEGMEGKGATRIPSIAVNTAELYHGNFYKDKPDDISQPKWDSLVKEHISGANDYRSTTDWQRTNNLRFHPGRDSTHEGPLYIGEQRIDNHPYTHRNPYDPHTIKSSFSSLFNPLGKASYAAGTALWNAVDPKNHGGKTSALNAAAALTGGSLLKETKKFTNKADMENYIFHTQTGVRGFVDASFSYTPYMIAKAETARRWDNKQMDEAIYEGIDGALSFNLSKVKKSLSDIGELLIRPPQTIQDPITGGAKTPDYPQMKVNAATIERSSMQLPAHRTLH